MDKVQTWNGPGTEPHSYSPDIQAMGDCRICGHIEEDHAEVRERIEKIAAQRSKAAQAANPPSGIEAEELTRREAVMEALLMSDFFAFSAQDAENLAADILDKLAHLSPILTVKGEAVAWVYQDSYGGVVWDERRLSFTPPNPRTTTNVQPLYASPPPAEIAPTFLGHLITHAGVDSVPVFIPKGNHIPLDKSGTVTPVYDGPQNVAAEIAVVSVEEIAAVLEPFAALARVRYPDEGGAPSWIDIMTASGECDELELRSHVAMDRHSQILDAESFRQAEAILTRLRPSVGEG